MADWLTSTLTAPDPDSAIAMAIRLGTAFVCGCVIAGIHRLVRPHQPSMASFPGTIVLLAILCAMLPLVIGENIAWAFGLVGALSIVRFRTVVEDTHDITFVIFAVLVGMAVGADRLQVAIVGIAVTGAAAFLVRTHTGAGPTKRESLKVTVRVAAGNSPDTLLSSIFDEYLDSHRLSSGSTTKQGTSLELTYVAQLAKSASPTGLLETLSRTDGIQNVSLRGL